MSLEGYDLIFYGYHEWLGCVGAKLPMWRPVLCVCRATFIVMPQVFHQGSEGCYINGLNNCRVRLKWIGTSEIEKWYSPHSNVTIVPYSHVILSWFSCMLMRATNIELMVGPVRFEPRILATHEQMLNGQIYTGCNLSKNEGFWCQEFENIKTLDLKS